MCNGVIISVLLVLIVCIVRGKPQLVSHTKHHTVKVVPVVSFNDPKGEKIKGGGLTRLTTPARKACAQLMAPHSQETSVLRKDDF